MVGSKGSESSSEPAVIQAVRDAVRALNDAIAVAAVHGLQVELETTKYHHVGEVTRVVVEVEIRKARDS
jgi:hypothetical protein